MRTKLLRNPGQHTGGLIRKILENRTMGTALSSNALAGLLHRHQSTVARHLRHLRELDGCDLRSRIVWFDQFAYKKVYWIETTKW